MLKLDARTLPGHHHIPFAAVLGSLLRVNRYNMDGFAYAPPAHVRLFFLFEQRETRVAFTRPKTRRGGRPVCVCAYTNYDDYYFNSFAEAHMSTLRVCARAYAIVFRLSR